MLHIVNGDHVADKLRQSKVKGDILVWRELYPFGPVFPDTDEGGRQRRAAYLEERLGIPASNYAAGCEAQERALDGLDAYDEAVLWFEHDLFDQTMLWHLLHRLRKQPMGRTKLQLLCIGDYPGFDVFRGLGQLSPGQLEGLAGTWTPIGEKELELGSRLWQAYASPDIERQAGILQTDAAALPFAHAAFRLHLSRLPSPAGGLGIVEETTLALAGDGIRTTFALFDAVGERLNGLGMGDLEFWHVLKKMASPPHPLLTLEGAPPFPEYGAPPAPAFRQSAVTLTELGRRASAGETEWPGAFARETWYGGLCLNGDPGWRWDRSEDRLVPRPAKD